MHIYLELKEHVQNFNFFWRSQDERRLNVGITRARRLLVIIGSESTLTASQNAAWSALLQHYRSRGAIPATVAAPTHPYPYKLPASEAVDPASQRPSSATPPTAHGRLTAGAQKVWTRGYSQTSRQLTSFAAAPTFRHSAPLSMEVYQSVRLPPPIGSTLRLDVPSSGAHLGRQPSLLLAVVNGVEVPRPRMTRPECIVPRCTTGKGGTMMAACGCAAVLLAASLCPG
jgi:hypothetical protein